MSPCDRVPSGRPPLACTASGCHWNGPTPGACRLPSPTPQHPATHVSLCLSKVQTGTEWATLAADTAKRTPAARARPARRPRPGLSRVQARGCSLALPKCQLAFLIINFSLNVISNCSCSTEDTTQASAESARFGGRGEAPRPRRALRSRGGGQPRSPWVGEADGRNERQSQPRFQHEPQRGPSRRWGQWSHAQALGPGFRPHLGRGTAVAPAAKRGGNSTGLRGPS